MNFTSNLALAIVIFLVGRWIAKKTINLLKQKLINKNTDETLIKFICNVAYGLAIAFIVIIALGKLGIETTSLVAVLAAIGLAIGFALQGSLANIAAGVMIITFKPFKIGDFIEAGGTSGTVEEVGIFHTILKGADNKTIISPNAKLTGDNIINHSTKK